LTAVAHLHVTVAVSPVAKRLPKDYWELTEAARRTLKRMRRRPRLITTSWKRAECPSNDYIMRDSIGTIAGGVPDSVKTCATLPLHLEPFEKNPKDYSRVPPACEAKGNSLQTCHIHPSC